MVFQQLTPVSMFEVLNLLEMVWIDIFEVQHLSHCSVQSNEESGNSSYTDTWTAKHNSNKIFLLIASQHIWLATIHWDIVHLANTNYMSTGNSSSQESSPIFLNSSNSTSVVKSIDKIHVCTFFITECKWHLFHQIP
jgi:hypothetical protein